MILDGIQNCEMGGAGIMVKILTIFLVGAVLFVLLLRIFFVQCRRSQSGASTKGPALSESVSTGERRGRAGSPSRAR